MDTNLPESIEKDELSLREDSSGNLGIYGLSDFENFSLRRLDEFGGWLLGLVSSGCIAWLVAALIAPRLGNIDFFSSSVLYYGWTGFFNACLSLVSWKILSRLNISKRINLIFSAWSSVFLLWNNPILELCNGQFFIIWQGLVIQLVGSASVLSFILLEDTLIRKKTEFLQMNAKKTQEVERLEQKETDH